jgi:hypothetical protein
LTPPKLKNKERLVKKRLGFVSNSSSSSFIVFLKKEPKDEHELIETLFPDRFDDVVSCGSTGVTVTASRFTEEVWHQLQDHNRLSKKERNRTLENLVYELLYFQSPAMTLPTYKKQAEELRVQAKKNLKELMEKHGGDFVFVVSFADNEGEEGCAMEHGNGLRNVEHLVVSHH